MPDFRFAAMLIAGLAAAVPAQAETRIFVVNGNDGYGIDRCLAAGEPCGTLAANALCRAREFAQAVNFGRVDPKEITGAVPEGLTHCAAKGCTETVAITCAR
ncbi:MAG: hypothetical protein IT539_12060 [Bradyrhizobiaceae bacterium]|nr:hypothetical protein [Bradyrhizobiaceae bacterium]